MTNIRTIHSYLLAAAILPCALLFASCSTTKNIPEGDQLFIGLEKTEYGNYEKTNISTPSRKRSRLRWLQPRTVHFSAAHTTVHRFPTVYGYGMPFPIQTTR